MNIFRLAFELFVLYLLYKLIFDFIIPLVSTAKEVKKQFGEMSAQMQDKMNQQQAPNNFATKGTVPPADKRDDYIEFEEVKK
ncbi:MAG: hypothetical protein JWP81_3308 [Ferruginibacter sp.]|nr:hypothetical protein [Ferruginibacter sp.]